MINTDLNRIQPLQQWHDAVASIISKGISDNQIDHLVDTLRQLINGDGCSLMVYPKGRHPYCPFRKRAGGGDPRVYVDQYLESAYLLDPFYRLAFDKETNDQQLPAKGVFSLHEVAPNGFQESELYRLYYQLINFGDEICIIVPTPDKASIQISISRQANSPLFNQEQITLIDSLFSVIHAILLNWWDVSKKSNKQTFLKSHLERALSYFGSSVLTLRETQVLQLMLRGYAVKSIAQKLGITPETIKHHRKNIYLKLDVGSQAEMFHLFIDSLRMVTPNSPLDPLTNYFLPLKNA